MSISQWYFKPSHRLDSDNGKSNSGGQASKNHSVELGASEQQSVITTECNEVVNDEHKSEDSGDLTVNYMSPGPDGPAQ